MCGIIGFSTVEPNNDNYKLLNRIVEQSKIRGLHSFGYSYYKDNMTVKKFHNLTEVDLPKTNKLIYHNRYSTSGDYLNHQNNQPIFVNNISLVFNGVIDMGTKEQMQDKYNINMETDNDGEILIKKCGFDYDAIVDFVKNMTGSFAGLLMHKDKVIFIRNSRRPAWIVKKHKAYYIASTKDILLRANNSLEPYSAIPNKIYEI